MRLFQRFILAIALLAVPLQGFSISNKKAENKFAKLFYRTIIPQHSFLETVSFHAVNGAMFVTVSIDGQNYNFLFDTGAITIVTPELAAKLHLKQIGVNEVGDSYNASKQLPVFTINKLKLGNTEFSKTSCLTTDMTALSSATCQKIDGILGANLFRECYWKINTPGQFITCSDKPLPIAEGTIALPFLEGAGGAQPFLKATYADTSFYMEFDTGNNGPSALPDAIMSRRFAAAHPKKYALGSGATVQTIYGNKAGMRSRTIDTLKVGDVVFPDVLIDGLQDASPTIGTSFIYNDEVQLDWKKHLIYFTKIREGGAIDSSFIYIFGAALSLSEGKIIVSFRWDGTDAARQGIPLNAIIKSLNGESLSNMTPEGYCLLKEKIRQQNELSLITLDDMGLEKKYILKRSLILE